MGTLVLKSNPLRLYNVYLAEYTGNAIYLSELVRASDDGTVSDSEVTDEIKHEGRLAAALGRHHTAINAEPAALANVISWVAGRVTSNLEALASYAAPFTGAKPSEELPIHVTTAD